MKFSLKSLKKSWFDREFWPISYILWCLRSVQAVSEQANFSVVKERHLILARRWLHKTAYHSGFLMAYDALESLISAFIHSRLLAKVERLFAISLKLETTWTLKHHKMSRVDETSLPKSEFLRAFKKWHSRPSYFAVSGPMEDWLQESNQTLKLFEKKT